MKIKEILELLEQKVPLSLSHAAINALGAYDNSGFILDGGNEDTNSVVFALDLTCGAVDLAVKNGANFIITHHPAIYRPVKSVSGLYTKCIAAGISVYSTHLSLDTAHDGIEDGLARIIGAKNTEMLEQTTEGYGFGRYFEIESVSFKELIKKISEALKTQKMMVFGDENRTINKVASFCGAGLDEGAIARAKDAELLVSADISHHVLLAAIDKDKCVLQLTHYASEAFAMQAFCQKFCLENNIKYDFYLDERFL